MNEIKNEIKKDKLWENDKTFLAACVTYFVVLLLFIAIRVISGFGLLDGLNDKFVDISFSIVSQALIMLLIPLFAMKVFSKQSLKKTIGDFGFNRPGGKVIGYAFVLGVLLYIFNIFVAGAFSSVLTLLGYRFPTSDSSFTGISGLFISLVLTGVLPGLCEEANHRGMLMNAFANKLGIGRALMLSSVIFGLMHLNIVQVFYAAILGYIIALAVVATRSIWTGVIMHFMNNAIGVYLQFARDNKWVLSNILQPLLDLFSQPYGMFLFLIFIYFVYLLIMEIIHKFAKENYKKNEKVYFANYLKANPQFVAAKVEKGESVSMDEMSEAVSKYLTGLNKRQALKFYIDEQRKPQKLNTMEKTFLYGILFLGTLVTAFTFIWGML